MLPALIYWEVMTASVRKILYLTQTLESSVLKSGSAQRMMIVQEMVFATHSNGYVSAQNQMSEKIVDVSFQL